MTGALISDGCAGARESALLWNLPAGPGLRRPIQSPRSVTLSARLSVTKSQIMGRLREGRIPPIEVSPRRASRRLLVEPAPVRQAAQDDEVRSAATLAPSFSALEADVAAQLAPVRRIERSQLCADWHRYAASWDHRRFINAGGRHPPLMGVGVGKRRWYATIFSFDRPRSRRISTERLGVSLSQAGFTRRLRGPCPADRWSSRAPIPPCFSRPFRHFSRQ